MFNNYYRNSKILRIPVTTTTNNAYDRSCLLRPASSGGIALQRELGLYENSYTRQNMQARVFTKNISTNELNRYQGIINLFEVCTEHDMLLCALHWRLSRRELYAIQASQLFGPTWTDNEDKTTGLYLPWIRVRSVVHTTYGERLSSCYDSW